MTIFSKQKIEVEINLLCDLKYMRLKIEVEINLLCDLKYIDLFG